MSKFYGMHGHEDGKPEGPGAWHSHGFEGLHEHPEEGLGEVLPAPDDSPWPMAGRRREREETA